MKDIHDFDAIVKASCSFDQVQGYYPGTGPDGSGDAQEPDGPLMMLSPLLYAVDHGELPAYLLEAVREVAVNGNPEDLDDALIKELQDLGYSQSDIEALTKVSDDEPSASPAATPSKERKREAGPNV